VLPENVVIYSTGVDQGRAGATLAVELPVNTVADTYTLVLATAVGITSDQVSGGVNVSVLKL
jgi:trans-aconitate methyltransferase